jgi:uncharacterized protein (TIRG00374 family)
VTPEPAKRSWKGVALRLGGSAVALALLLWMLPLDQLWAAMRRLPLWVFLLTLAAYMAVHAVASLKWRRMVNTAGAGLGVALAARCYFAGLFGNVFLPSIVGGDLIRAGLAMRSAQHRAGAVLASLVDRMLDVLALGLLAGFGALMVPRALDERSQRVFLALAAAFALLALGVAILVALFPARKFSHRRRRKLVKLRQAVRAMARQPGRVATVLALAICLQASFALLNAWIGKWCGLEIPLYVWLFAWPLGKVSAMLPVTQGGIGVREAALAALLLPFGVPAVLSVAVGLIWQMVVVSGGLLGGGIALLAGQRRFSAQEAEGAEAVKVGS